MHPVTTEDIVASSAKGAGDVPEGEKGYRECGQQIIGCGGLGSGADQRKPLRFFFFSHSPMKARALFFINYFLYIKKLNYKNDFIENNIVFHFFTFVFIFL